MKLQSITLDRQFRSVIQNEVGIASVFILPGLSEVFPVNPAGNVGERDSPAVQDDSLFLHRAIIEPAVDAGFGRFHIACIVAVGDVLIRKEVFAFIDFEAVEMDIVGDVFPGAADGILFQPDRQLHGRYSQNSGNVHV